MNARLFACGWFGLALAACTPDNPVSNGPSRHAPDIEAAEHLTDLRKTGFGAIAFPGLHGRSLAAQVYRAQTFEPTTGPILFVMHGAGRNPTSYLKAAAPVAERSGALAIAIEFSRDDYPKGNDYTLGVVTRGVVDRSALAQNRWRSPSRYVYMEVERLFDRIRRYLGGTQPDYYLFGHSAGAQFVHRLLTFVPEARVRRAVAANAGWYTLPLTDADNAVPYSLAATPLADSEPTWLLRAPLTILVGENDTADPSNDDMVRGTPAAMAQGRNRAERAHHYFSIGALRAEQTNTAFGWDFAEVPVAAHEVRPMAAWARSYLFGRSQPSCSGSPITSVDLTVTEFLADPPRGRAGDANGDGERDPQADEFVELVNDGPSAVCLTGWSLGDVRNPYRHVFPPGPALEPGASLIVFGGGVPTGSFGGAIVQWAAQGGQLGFTNRGDVITLRNAQGERVLDWSWGDCGGVACAADHVSLEDVEGSVTRAGLERTGVWVAHATLGSPYSPGTMPSGASWKEAQ